MMMSEFVPALPVRPVPHDAIEGDWWLAWNFDPQYLIPVVLLGFIYARGLARWTERSRPHSAWRTTSFYAGLALLVLIYESPLDRLGEHHFSFHMIQHSIAMMIVPPLIYLGAPSTPVLRGLPKGFRRAVVQPVLNHPVTRSVWNFLTFPPIAVVIFSVTQWAWHLMPGWYDAALNDDVIHNIQHITFLAVAMLFWWNIVDPKPRRSRIPMGMRIIYLYAAMVPKHVLAAMITFSDRVFYETYERRELFIPLSPADDQQLAGVLMWVPFGEIFNLVVAAIIFMQWWGQSERNQRAEEAQRDREREAALVGGG